MPIVPTDHYTPPHAVGMSATQMLTSPEEAYTIVGSCIALALYHPELKLGILGHIVLPKSNGKSSNPGKYADTAIPHMVKTLSTNGANQAGLIAKYCGGASMFGTQGLIQIGEQNIKAVAETLKQLNIPICGTHLAGSKGRHATFDCHTGNLIVEIASEAVNVL